MTETAGAPKKPAGIGNVVVLHGEAVCGIVTDRDIVVRGIADGRDPRATTLGDVCSRTLTTLSPDDQLAVLLDGIGPGLVEPLTLFIPNNPNATFGLPRTMLNPRQFQFAAKFSF